MAEAASKAGSGMTRLLTRQPQHASQIQVRTPLSSRARPRSSARWRLVVSPAMISAAMRSASLRLILLVDASSRVVYRFCVTGFNQGPSL